MGKRLLALLILLLTMVFVQPVNADLFSDLDLKVNEYNQHADQVPSAIKSLLGNEVIYLLIEMNDGSQLHIEAVTEDAVVTTFEEFDPAEDIGATVKVITNENTVYEVMESENPVQTFRDAMDSKDIVIEPIGLVNTVKFQVANIVLKLSEILGIA